MSRLFSVFRNSSRTVQLLESRWALTLCTRLRKSALFCGVTSATEPSHLNEESQAAFCKSADSIDDALLQLLTSNRLINGLAILTGQRPVDALLQLLTSNRLINGLAILTGQRPVALHPDYTVFDSNTFF